MPRNAHILGSQDIFTRTDYAPVRQDKQPPGRLGGASPQPATAGNLAVGQKGGRATAKEHTDRNNTATANEHQTAIPDGHKTDTAAPLDYPTHHGSETRQTSQVTGRVAPHIKTRLLELGKAQGWTESKLVGEAVAAYVEQDLGEKFGVRLAGKVSDAIEKGLAKHGKREAYLSAQAYYAAEEARILNAKVLSYLFGQDTQMYQQTLKQARIEAYQNLKHKVEEKEESKA